MANYQKITNLPELGEAVGDETVVGVSNGSVVRIPVDAIGGGGSVEPMFLRDKGTSGFGTSIVYLDGSSVTIDDIYNAFIIGTPIFIGYTPNAANANDLGYNQSSPLAQIICVDYNSSKIVIMYNNGSSNVIYKALSV